ncbi:MAG: hypothetical protein WD048_13635 [Chitinophagales bacterium]
MNQDSEIRLKALRGKISDFAEKYKEKELRIHALEKENLNLKAELKNKLEFIAEMEEKLKVVKLAGQVRGEEKDNSANNMLKNKLNEYIKEIDKCVALLNN